MRFARDARGFTGAEKALLVCVALAIVLAVGRLVSGGSQAAGGDAARTLAAGAGPVSAIAGSPRFMAAAAMPHAQGLTSAPAVEGPQSLPNGQADVAYDGAVIGQGGQAYPPGTPLSQVPPVLPQNGPPAGTIVYVNGITTTKDDQAGAMQDIANATGDQVIGIHNATEGFVKDVEQSAGDKFNLGHNPPVDTLADAMHDSIMAGQPIHVVAHSQGALITSRALFELRQRLIIEDGLTPQQAEQKMGLIQVETFGGAASNYPDGPQYRHYVNLLDPVPMAFGMGAPGSYGGKGAQIIRFTGSVGGGVTFHNPFTWPPTSPVSVSPPDVHGLVPVYLPHRQPWP